MIRKLTTVVVVDAIEPALPAWERLGFTRIAEVSHEERLGFVILGSEGAELMLQTRASLAADLGIAPPPLALYAEVDALDEARAAFPEVVIERRTTFYGATESWVRDAAGTLVGLAQHQA